MHTGKEKLCLMVCRHFLQETESIVLSEGYDDLEVHAYPPACTHAHLSSAVLEQISEHLKDEKKDVLLLGGCFLTSRKVMDRLPKECRIQHLEQCFYLLAGKHQIDEYLDTGAYLLTPGWLAEWPVHLREWGFDQQTARDFFRESTASFMLLDTGIDAKSSERFADFTAYMNLPGSIVNIGLDYFSLVIAKAVLEWRLENKRNKLQIDADLIKLKMSEQAMALDLMAKMTGMKTEDEAIEQIINLFSMLFAPGKIIYASVQNDAVEKTYSSPPPPPDILLCQSWLDKSRSENTWNEAEKGFYLRISHQDQTIGMLEISAVAFPEYQREYLNLAMFISKVCGLAISNARLFQDVHQLAVTDPLTIMHNRRHFFYMAEGEFIRTRRYNRPLSTIMLDIDNFKKINDTYGHAAGDKVLTDIAMCCKRELRASDICGRYGGEEFIFMLPETDPKSARAIAKRLCQSIAGLSIAVSGHTLKVTASLGLASLDADIASLDVLIKRSDHALYEAKRSGKNRVCNWSPEINLA